MAQQIIRTTARFALAVLLFSPCLCRANAPVLVYDPTLSGDDLTPWLAYSGGRLAYREKHKLSSPASGEIIPSFEEEVSARGLAAASYLVLHSSKDPYWETVARVEKAGFLREYVWTYLHRQTWSARDHPKNLEAFEKWRAVNLRNHTPQMRAKLMVR